MISARYELMLWRWVRTLLLDLGVCTDGWLYRFVDRCYERAWFAFGRRA